MFGVSFTLNSLAKYQAQLEGANKVLRLFHLPPYYLGGTRFSSEYEWENTPRRIWKWNPMGHNLDQLYLRHKPTGQVVNIHDLSGNPYRAD